MTIPRQIYALAFYFIAVTTFVFYTFVPHTLAQQPVAEPAVSVANNSDIRVLIDVSGSMKQNDPRNLRRPALDLLVQLFPTDSRAGIWSFGKYVNMLAPHSTVSNAWRDQSSNKSRLINSVALHTNIGLALEKAIYDGGQKKYSDTNNFNTSVILLTDGVVDIAKDPLMNEQERQRILEELLPRYQAAGIAIHAVALSTNADVELLERLAIETDGIFAVAEDAEDLNRIFLRAFDQSSPSDRAPLEDNRFLIDSSVEEFTALVFKQEGSEATNIQSPTGQVFNAKSEGASLRWFASDAYDLITIQQPEEGEWTINADIDPENRVTVVSDLTLAIAPIANNLYHGEAATLTASMLEGAEVVSNNALLDLFTVNASMSRSNTQFWRQTLIRDSDDVGVYSRELNMLRNSGDYALSVMVDGKTFKREKKLKFTVREPFRVELAANELDGEFTLTVMADDKRLRTHDVVLTAAIKLPDGSDSILELNSEQAGVWSYQAVEQGTGSYVIHLTAAGYNTEARAVNYVLAEQDLYLNVPGIAEPIAKVEAEVIIEPETIVESDAEVSEDIAEPPALAEEKSSWLPYIVLIVGNLLLIGLLFFIYKKMTGSQSTVNEKPTDSNDDSVVTSPPLVGETYKDIDTNVEETVKKNKDGSGDETKLVDEKVDEQIDVDAVDISVDEAAGESSITEPELEPIVSEVIDEAGYLNTLLDIEAEESEKEDSEKEDSEKEDKEQSDQDESDIAGDADDSDASNNTSSAGVDSNINNEDDDDVDIEFDLSADDGSSDDRSNDNKK